MFSEDSKFLSSKQELTPPLERESSSPMQKIVVLGPSGAGKSTFVRKLAEVLGFTDEEIHHLDEYFWGGRRNPDHHENDRERGRGVAERLVEKIKSLLSGKPRPRSWIADGESLKQKLLKILPKDKWIMDGNYRGHSLEERIKNCDVIILYTPVFTIRAWRIFKRFFGQTFGTAERVGMSDQNKESLFSVLLFFKFLKHNIGYEERALIDIESKIKNASAGTEIVVLGNNSDVGRFLENPHDYESDLSIRDIKERATRNREIFKFISSAVAIVLLFLLNKNKKNNE